MFPHDLFFGRYADPRRSGYGARMCAAARTAPKTRGMDGLVTCVVTGEDKDRLAAHMRELAGQLDYAFFARDADNVDYADAVVLFGMEEQRRGLNGGCQYCHFADCADCAEKNGLCAWDAMDVGIAIGKKKSKYWKNGPNISPMSSQQPAN